MVSNGEPLAEYTILDFRIPPTADLDKDVEWFCKCFGFLESRDKEKTAARIFKTLLEAMKQGKGLSSDELAEKIGLTRGTMVYHLNKLIQSGLAVHREGRYELRGMSLRRTVQEVRRDINRVLENIEQVAQSIDEALGLTYR
ncbi:MAG: helix-turn-helix domain-containing protein [Candidatus Bathyarchaeia archaeon]